MDTPAERHYDAVLHDVCQRMHMSGVESRCRRLVEKRLLEWNGSMDEIDQEIMRIMREETTVHMKNFIFHYAQKNEAVRVESFAEVDTNGGSSIKKVEYKTKSVGGKGCEDLMEPLTYVKKAQEHWQQKVLRSVHSMSTELTVPLLKRRSDKEQREMSAKWGELSTSEVDLSRFRPVYASKDFLEVVCQLRNPNEYLPTDKIISLFLVKVNLQRKSFAQLQRCFDQLHNSQPQTGLDDIISETFKQHRNKLACEVMQKGLSEDVQSYLRKGAPVSLRGALWKLSLGCEESRGTTLYWERLKKAVVVQDLLVDYLIYKDVKLTATNDDKYFVFEDFLYQVLLCFSRDEQVHSNLINKDLHSGKLFENLKDLPRNKPPNHLKFPEQPYPPSGVIPFHGFAMYLAPLCYVYDSPISLYLVFRELYTRHFHHLHTLSSSSQGIVALCVQFESLLLSREPRLFLHLRSLGLHPLKVAFKWMLRAFSGFLSCEQVLILWDRIIGYNSVTLLPLLAASIFSYRKENLLQASSASSAESIMADILTLEVIPLLQLFLFAHNTVG